MARVKLGYGKYAKRPHTAAGFALALIGVVFAATLSHAYDSVSQYSYDDLSRLVSVTVRAEVNGKTPRMVYTTTYTYDKNGNRVGMARQAGVPEIDAATIISQVDGIVRVGLDGINFQEGMLVSVVVPTCGTISGTILSLSATHAEVEFTLCSGFGSPASIGVETPDGQVLPQNATAGLDTTGPFAPIVTGTTPTNDTTPTWSWSSGGGGGNGTFRYQLDGQAGPWVETTATIFTPGAPLPEGGHTLYVQERDTAGNWSATGSRTITVDVTAPTVTISAPSVSITATGPVTYTVTYGGADSVTLADGDVTVNATGTASATVVVSGTGNASRTVTLSSITGNGTLGISIAANTASDSAGNSALAASPSATFTVDDTVIAVNIGPPSTTLTRSGPVDYPVTYDNATSVTLGSGDITLNSTGTANATVGVSGTGNVARTVTLSAITGDGTLGFSIAAGTATDALSRSAPAAGPSGTFTVDNTAPVITLQGSNPIQVLRDTPYWDAGATATDNVDGNLTSQIIADTSAVDTSALGNYTVTYNVIDAAGNAAAQVTRTVQVVDSVPALPLLVWPVAAVLILAGIAAMRKSRLR